MCNYEINFSALSVGGLYSKQDYLVDNVVN